jgi:hypothetical protein
MEGLTSANIIGVGSTMDAVKDCRMFESSSTKFSARSEFKMQDPSISNRTLNTSSDAACTGFMRRSVLVECEQTIELIPTNGCYDAI